MTWQLLHQIRHFYFSEIIRYLDLFLYFMFPNYNFVRELYYSSSSGKRSSTDRHKMIYSILLKYTNKKILIDKIILLAIYKIIVSPNILTYYPATAKAIKASALASGSK